MKSTSGADERSAPAFSGFFFKVPVEMDDLIQRLKPKELKVFLVILRAEQRDTNGALLSVTQLAERSGLSRTHAHDAAEMLRSAGLVRVETQGKIHRYSTGIEWRDRKPTGERSNGPTESYRTPTGERKPTGERSPVCAQKVNARVNDVGADRSPTGETHSESRESLEFRENPDLDQQTTRRTIRDTRSASAAAPSFEEVGQLLGTYMGGESMPSRRSIAATQTVCSRYGATAQELSEVLLELWDSGYEPGTPNGPRTWAWFPTTIEDRLKQRREKLASYEQQGAPHWSRDRVLPIGPGLCGKCDGEGYADGGPCPACKGKGIEAQATPTRVGALLQ